MAYTPETEFFTADRDVRVRGKTALAVLAIVMHHIEPRDIPQLVNHAGELCFLPADIFARAAHGHERTVGRPGGVVLRAVFPSAEARVEFSASFPDELLRPAVNFIERAANQKLDSHLVFAEPPPAISPATTTGD